MTQNVKLKHQVGDGKEHVESEGPVNSQLLPPVKGQPPDSWPAEQCYIKIITQEKPAIQICE